MCGTHKFKECDISFTGMHYEYIVIMIYNMRYKRITKANGDKEQVGCFLSMRQYSSDQNISYEFTAQIDDMDWEHISFHGDSMT